MNQEEFWDILTAVPEPKPIFYRLYHDENGLPLFYSMEDLPGLFIEIDQATYAQNASNVRVVDGQLKHVKVKIVSRLIPSADGTPCDPRDITVVVDTGKPNQRWSKQTDVYEEC